VIYRVTLSEKQIVALVDIAEAYVGDDSPRHDGRTTDALIRRRLITYDGEELTNKGKAWLAMAQWEYRDARADLDEEEAA
jgi:hypothetical protein